MLIRKDNSYKKWIKVCLALFAFAMLAGIYILQGFDFLILIWSSFGWDTFKVVNLYGLFILNKTLRLILNDMACLILIYVFFSERKYLKIAFVVFLFELLVVLPFYFTVKLYFEGDSEISSPLLSQIHRLVVNPTLMILLMSAFFYQRFQEKKKIDS